MLSAGAANELQINCFSFYRTRIKGSGVGNCMLIERPNGSMTNIGLCSSKGSKAWARRYAYVLIVDLKEGDFGSVFEWCDSEGEI